MEETKEQTKEETPKAPRSIQEIQEEYVKCASKLGQIQFTIELFKLDIHKLCAKLVELKEEELAASKANKDAGISG